MNKLEFLIFGKNQSILEILIPLVNSNEEWNAVGFSDDQEAKDYFQHHQLDIVLLSSGIDKACEENMRTFFVTLQPEVEIIQHYGGGSGLLKCEILEVLEKRKSRKEAGARS